MNKKNILSFILEGISHTSHHVIRLAISSPQSNAAYHQFTLLTDGGYIHACVWRLKVASFIDIHQVFAKQMFGYLSNRAICIILLGWSLLPNALRPFQIYCAPPNLGIRTWICRLNFAQRPIFSGLRFFNEPEISDSVPPA